jgi:hypothetical protein
MPTIMRIATRPTTQGERLGGGEASLVSPDGRFSLRFHAPNEWHPGACGWQVSLLDGSRDVTFEHPQLAKVAGPRGFRWQHHDTPWSPDGVYLLLLTWVKPGVALYSLRGKLTIPLSPPPGFYLDALWAPGRNEALLVSSEAWVVCDIGGQVRIGNRWARPNLSGRAGFCRTAWWVAGGQYFLAWERVPTEPVSFLDLYRAQDGALVESRELEATGFFPDNDTMFTKMRDRLTALLPASRRAEVVHLAEEGQCWGDAAHDPRAGALLLEAMRPGRATRQGDTMIVPSDIARVAVTFG